MLVETCSIEGCLNKHFGRGWCSLHYNRWYKWGDPLVLKRIQKHITTNCSIVGCLNGGKLRRGWCSTHWQRWYHYGDTSIRKCIRGGDVEVRFLFHVDRSYVCWLWTGCINSDGYAKFGIGGRDGKMVSAHRWAYEHYVGPIPSGLQIDHLCRVRHCVNPMHLEPVTASENVRRSFQARARERTK